MNAQASGRAVGQGSDPLSALPPETVLCILSHLSAPALAVLESVSRSWNRFIATHSDQLYQHASRPIQSAYIDRHDLLHAPRALNTAVLEKQSYTNHWHLCSTWKEYSRHRHLVERNWRPPQRDRLPLIRETLIRARVWRFRPDFDARIIVCSSSDSCIFSVDMDTHDLLWRIQQSDDGVPVRAYAHLEYSGGYAVFDRLGDGVEVWRHLGHEDGHRGRDLAEHPKRGRFAKVAMLPHNRRIRGFMLSENTLCVISDQGRGFIYGLHRDRVEELLEIPLPDGAVGHLDQNEDVVMYSFGKRGFQLHAKADGAKLGQIDPKDPAYRLSPSRNFFHLTRPPKVQRNPISRSPFPLADEDDRRVLQLELLPGPLPLRTTASRAYGSPAFEHDEWGAGMLCGDWMVAVSLFGRVLVCSDWRGVLADPASAARTVSVIECDSGGSPIDFSMGGWLSIRDGKVLFEANTNIVVLTLPLWPGGLLEVGEAQPPLYAFPSFWTKGGPPISYMSLHSDAIFATYANYPMLVDQHDTLDEDFDVLRSKGIRVIDVSKLATDAAPCAEQVERRMGGDGWEATQKEGEHALDEVVRNMVEVTQGEEEGAEFFAAIYDEDG